MIGMKDPLFYMYVCNLHGNSFIFNCEPKLMALSALNVEDTETLSELHRLYFIRHIHQVLREEKTT